jgi:hypothetical protein
MNADFELPAVTDLRTLVAAVAGSPILAGAAQPAEAFFADWASARKSADVDALILAWIASHVRGAPHRGRTN